MYTYLSAAHVANSILIRWHGPLEWIEPVPDGQFDWFAEHCDPVRHVDDQVNEPQHMQIDLVDVPAGTMMSFRSRDCRFVRVQIHAAPEFKCSVHAHAQGVHQDDPHSLQAHITVTTLAGSLPPHIGERQECNFHDLAYDKEHNISPSAAKFQYPWGIVFDDKRRVMYVANNGCPEGTVTDDRLKQVTLDGVTSVVAGDGKGYRDGTGKTARFRGIASLAFDHGRSVVYAADVGNHCVRAIRVPDGVVTTVAGQARAGHVEGSNENDGGMLDGPCHGAVFDHLQGLVYHAGNHTLFVADTDNHRIRAIDMRGDACQVRTVAGQNVFGARNGHATHAYFKHPTSLALDEELGILYVGDHYNHRIRYIDLVQQQVHSLAGFYPGFCDGKGPDAAFTYPEGLGFDPAHKLLYIADFGSHTVRCITAIGHADGAGRVITVAGQVSQPGLQNGVGSQAAFYHPTALTVVPTDSLTTTLFVADQFNHRIRKVVIQLEGSAPALDAATTTFGWMLMGVAAVAALWVLTLVRQRAKKRRADTGFIIGRKTM